MNAKTNWLIIQYSPNECQNHYSCFCQKGCDIRLGRLRVFSYCGLLKKKIDRAVKQISSDLNEIHAPAIINQLQQFLKVRIGEEVAIPLLLGTIHILHIS